MNFFELKGEFSERGFAYLSQQRQGQYINRARARLDLLHRWPYRESSVTGVAPLLIATLGQVEAVSNETQGYQLELVGYGDLVNWNVDLSLIGAPQYWYRMSSGATPSIGTYPTSLADTIGVQFWKRTAVLTETDTPASPADYHMLIVDMAVQLAYRDADNHQAAEALQIDIDRQLAEMVDDLLPQQEPTLMHITGESADW